MKTLFYIFLNLLVIAVNGQSNCFESCYSNFDQSKIPVPQRNFEILSNLIGCKAPGFNVVSIDGTQIDSDLLRGRIVVLNFWFEACAPCIEELPELNELVEKYRNKKVVFIAFGRDNPKVINEFLKTKKFDYQIIPVVDGLAKKFCILAGWPTNMVLDKNGYVRQIFSGGKADKNKREIFDRLDPIITKYLDD